MSKKRRGSVPVTVRQPLIPQVISLFTLRPQTSGTCKCRSKKYHRGGKCPAQTPGRDDECTWCAKGHPDHGHHDEHRHKPRRQQRTQPH